jgi:hypothetical protein
MVTCGTLSMHADTVRIPGRLTVNKHHIYIINRVHTFYLKLKRVENHIEYIGV